MTSYTAQTSLDQANFDLNDVKERLANPNSERSAPHIFNPAGEDGELTQELSDSIQGTSKLISDWATEIFG